jgi:hypothetical protein
MTRVASDLREVVEVVATSLPELDDFVDFAAAGSDAAGEFRCADCGYGVVVSTVLPACPMCRGTVWERREPSASRFAC